jgi:prefoldin subunit 5
LEERLGLNRMFACIENVDNKIEVVYMWEVSRLARKQSICHIIKERLIEEKKINLKCFSPHFSMLDKDGNLDDSADSTFTHYAQFAETEMRNKEARFARTKKANALQSKFSGGFIKFGYSKNEKGYYIINEEEAEIIRLIYNLYFQSNSYAGITRELQELGYNFSVGKVIGILKSKEYTGEIQKQKIIINKGKTTKVDGFFRIYPPIISNEMFQKRMEQGKKNATETTKAKSLYYCAKLIKCSICGSYFVGSSVNVNYYCYKNRTNEKLTKREKCSCSTTINVNWLDSIVWDCVKSYNAKYLQEQAKEDIIIHKKEIETLQLKINSVEKTIQNFNKKIERAADNFTEGIYTKEQRNEQIEKHRNKIKKINEDRLNWENEVKRLSDRIISINDSLNTNKTEIGEFIEYYNLKTENDKIMDDQTRYNLIHKHVKEIQITPDKFDGKDAKRIDITYFNNKIDTRYFCYNERKRNRRIGFFRIAKINGKVGFYNRTPEDISYIEFPPYIERFEKRKYRSNKDKDKDKE